MSRKSYLVLAVLAIIFLSGCTTETKNNNIQTNTCKELTDRLDKEIVDTNNPPGRFIIEGFEGIVGGTLTNIKNNGLDRGYNSYILTFKGSNSEGELYLITSSKSGLPYKIGQFYKFDLANKSKTAALNGGFIDNNLDKLTPVDCP